MTPLVEERSRGPAVFAPAEATARAAVPAATGFHSGQRLPELDGLRGVAILLVLGWHYFRVPAAAPPGSVGAALLMPLDLAWSGVDLFFVLSGFLIGGILLDARESPRYFRTFYVRRVCRIFPLYYLVFALFAGGVLLWGNSSVPVLQYLFGRPLPLAAYGLFVQNVWMASACTMGPAWMNPTWSLAVEEQFYLTLPLLVRFVPRRTLALVLPLLVVAALLLRLHLFAASPCGALGGYVLTWCRADALCLGVLAAVAARNPALWRRLAAGRCALAVVGAVLLLGLVYLVATGSASPGGTALLCGVQTWVALFYFVLLLLALTNRGGYVSRALRWGPLQECGVLCYGLYLFHEPVKGVCHGLFFGAQPAIADTGGLAVTVLALVVTFVLAKLSWTFFEKPIVKLGHRLAY